MTMVEKISTEIQMLYERRILFSLQFLSFSAPLRIECGMTKTYSLLLNVYISNFFFASHKFCAMINNKNDRNDCLRSKCSMELTRVVQRSSASRTTETTSRNGQTNAHEFNTIIIRYYCYPRHYCSNLTSYHWYSMKNWTICQQSWVWISMNVYIYMHNIGYHLLQFLEWFRKKSTWAKKACASKNDQIKE